MVLALVALMTMSNSAPAYSVVVTRRLGVSADAANALASSLAVALEARADQRLGRLLPPDAARAKLTAAGLPESVVCNGSAPCAATLARVLGLSHLIALQVVKIGGDLALDVSVVQHAGSQSVAAVTRTVNAKSSAESMPAIAGALLAALPAGAPPPERSGDPPPPTLSAPPPPPVDEPPSRFALHGEAEPSFLLSRPQAELYGPGVSLRATGLFAVAPAFDLAAHLSYSAWTATANDPGGSGASMLTVGAGARVRRPWDDALLVPTLDLGLSYVITGQLSALLSNLALHAGGALLLRGSTAWPFLLGPMVRFEYVFKVQSEPGYPGFDVGHLSVGLAFEYAPAATAPNLDRLAPRPAGALLDDDEDGVSNDLDQCPRVKGLARLEGCPEDDPDADGVRGARDDCPLTPGVAELNGCPPDDPDGDGVRGNADACPRVAGLPELNGCPSDDADGDGVRGVADQCPEKKGAPEDNGCPRRLFVKVTEKKIELLQKILFAFGKTTILPRSSDLLHEVGQVLLDNAAFCVRIEGHTDSIGGAKKNKTLSQGRADAVRAFLIDAGVASNRTYAVGYGMEIPRDTNGSADGRENNRRVEFVFVPCTSPELAP